MATIVHHGPVFYDKGTLTAAGRDKIFATTGVSAGIRERAQWGKRRGLSLSGPAAKIDQALAMADEMIKLSAQPASADALPQGTDSYWRDRRHEHSSRTQREAQDAQCGGRGRTGRTGRGRDRGSYDQGWQACLAAHQAQWQTAWQQELQLQQAWGQYGWAQLAAASSQSAARPVSPTSKSSSTSTSTSRTSSVAPPTPTPQAKRQETSSHGEESQETSWNGEESWDNYGGGWDDGGWTSGRGGWADAGSEDEQGKWQGSPATWQGSPDTWKGEPSKRNTIKKVSWAEDAEYYTPKKRVPPQPPSPPSHTTSRSNKVNQEKMAASKRQRSRGRHGKWNKIQVAQPVQPPTSPTSRDDSNPSSAASNRRMRCRRTQDDSSPSSAASRRRMRGRSRNRSKSLRRWVPKLQLQESPTAYRLRLNEHGSVRNQHGSPAE